jgi:hypothetical protein
MTMIFVDRGRLHNGQPILPLGNWMARAANKTTDAINDGPTHIVTDLYRDPGVKAALERLFTNKCAYCETGGFAGFPWDVEHFRPKGSVAEDRSHRYVSSQMRHRFLLFPKLPPGAGAVLGHCR